MFALRHDATTIFLFCRRTSRPGLNSSQDREQGTTSLFSWQLPDVRRPCPHSNSNCRGFILRLIAVAPFTWRLGRPLMAEFQDPIDARPADAESLGDLPRQKSLNRFGPRSSYLAASSSHRRPTSVILIRPTAIALPVSVCAVASPARTSLASIWRVKPWTCMTASVAPNGLQASNRSARLCSPPRRRFRGLTVIVCDIVASRKSPADSGGASQGR